MSTRNAPRNINTRQQNRRINSEAKLINYIRTQLGEPLITVDVTEDQVLQCIDDAFLKFSEWVYAGDQNQVFVINTLPGVQDYILDERVHSIYGISIADGTSGYGGGGGAVNGIWQGLPMSSVMPPMYVPYINLEGQQSSLEGYGGNFASATGVAGGVSGPHSGGGNGQDGIEPMYAAWTNMQTYQNLFSTNISFDFNKSNHILRIFDEVGGSVALEAGMDYVPNPEFDDAYGNPWIKKYALNLVKKVWGNNVGKYDSPLIGGSQINYQRLLDEANQEIEVLHEEMLQGSAALGVFSG